MRISCSSLPARDLDFSPRFTTTHWGFNRNFRNLWESGIDKIKSWYRSRVAEPTFFGGNQSEKCGEWMKKILTSVMHFERWWRGMQKTFSHPTTQPALRCSKVGFSTARRIRGDSCVELVWFHGKDKKSWFVMLCHAPLLSLCIVTMLCFSISMYWEHQIEIMRCTLDRWSSPRRSSCGRQWTWRQPASAMVITAMIHHDPWPKCCDVQWYLQKVWNHPPRFRGFVKHLDTSRIRNGSTSVPDWSIFFLL